MLVSLMQAQPIELFAPATTGTAVAIRALMMEILRTTALVVTGRSKLARCAARLLRRGCYLAM
jgi:hypothetical protein